MSRLGALRESDLNPQQRALREAMTSGPRGSSAASGGPFEVWLHSPAFGDRVQQFGAHVRYSTSLAPRVSELAILVCARRWSASYEWFVHAPIAEKAGVPREAIEALGAGRLVQLADETDSAIYSFCTELLSYKRVSDATYERALGRLGKASLIELVGVLGYYSLVALTINAFEVVPPDSQSDPNVANLPELEPDGISDQPSPCGAI